MRCYNGQPDKDLQALLDDLRKAGEELAAVGLRATYFPMEGKWMVFDKNHRPIDGFHSSKRDAADAAMRILKEGK